MSAYKDKTQGTWYVSFRYIDWTGKKTQKLVKTCNRRADQISEMDSVLKRVLQTRTGRRVARIIYGGIGK